jgi:hypothetical protein
LANPFPVDRRFQTIGGTFSSLSPRHTGFFVGPQFGPQVNAEIVSCNGSGKKRAAPDHLVRFPPSRAAGSANRAGWEFDAVRDAIRIAPSPKIAAPINSANDHRGAAHRRFPLFLAEASANSLSLTRCDTVTPCEQITNCN